MYIEVSVKYKTLVDAKEVKVSNVYLVDAPTFGVAETSALEYAIPEAIADGIVTITHEKLSRYTKTFVVSENAEYFVAIKVKLTIFDEDTGKEKSANLDYLVQADDMDEAKRTVENYLAGSASEYTICMVKITNIEAIIQNEIHI